MLDTLFLTYANHSFKDDPENLNKLFNKIFPFVSNNEIPAMTTQCKYIIDNIISFTKDNDPKVADKHREEIISRLMKQGVLNLEKPLLDIAFEAVYRYRDGYCEYGCLADNGIDLSKTPKKSGLKGDERLKCHECRQLHFISILSDIASGKHYETMIPKKSTITIDKEGTEIYKHNGLPFPHKIGNNVELPTDNQLTFETYIEKAYDCVGMEIGITNKGELESRPFVSLRNLTDVVPPPRYPFIKFSDYLISLVGYSLTKFLLGKDKQGRPNRIRLKRCPGCPKFFKADRLDKEYCSKECYSKHYHRKYMEEKRDPESPKYDEKYKTREFG